MLPYYFDIPLELSQEQKQTYIDFDKKNREEYIPHSPPDGTDHNIFLGHLPEELKQPIAELFKIPPSTVKIHTNEPNGYTLPHTDGVQWLRNSPCIIPITDNFAPTLFWQGEYIPGQSGRTYKEEDWIESDTPVNSAYFINTQIRHGLKNNETRRMAVQVWFQEDIETLFELHKQGELLR
tara:strand:- start:429 stop:968 length:540 start_codon:yes stop_codon:yes gene_type:complete